MVTRAPVSFLTLAGLLGSLLLTHRAGAQSAPASADSEEGELYDRTDPTVPSGPRPELTLSLPGGADTEHRVMAMPGDPWGDDAAAGLLSLRALFQGRYVGTYARASRSERESYRVREDNIVQQGDGYSLNRVFLRVGADPSKYVGFKALLDFAELTDNDPEDVIKQAYLTLRPLPRRLEIVVGLFKLPFSVTELDASSRFEFADYGQTNRLNGELGFAGRDLGVQVLAAPLRKVKRLRLSLGLFRGHAHDEHDSPAGLLGARAEAKPNKRWRIGADFVRHLRGVTYDRPFNTSDKDELPNPPNPLYPAQRRWAAGHAMSADVRYKKKSLMLRGEAQLGDRVDLDERYGARTFWAAWGLAAYRIDVTDSVHLLPAVRFEWLDADHQHKDRGVQQQLSVALNVLFRDRARFVLDVTRVDVQPGTVVINQPRPLLPEPYLTLDHVRLTAQLQLEL